MDPDNIDYDDYGEPLGDDRYDDYYDYHEDYDGYDPYYETDFSLYDYPEPLEENP